MEFREVLARRQSVRSYNGTPVTDSEITALLEAANASPIGRGLYQNVHLSVVRSKPLLKQVAAIAGEAFGDPNCIRLSYAVSDDVLMDALHRIKEALYN